MSAHTPLMSDEEALEQATRIAKKMGGVLVPLVDEVDRLRAELETAEQRFQQAFGCHPSWFDAGRRAESDLSAAREQVKVLREALEWFIAHETGLSPQDMDEQSNRRERVLNAARSALAQGGGA